MLSFKKFAYLTTLFAILAIPAQANALFKTVEKHSIQDNNNYSKVATDDMNNDNLEDAVFLDEDNNEVSVFKNLGNNRLKLSDTISFDNEISRIALGDFNQDNLTDIVVLSYEKNKDLEGEAKTALDVKDYSYINVILNQGGGNFADPVSYKTSFPGLNSSVVVEDLNKDGVDDVLVASGDIFFYENNGQGKLTKKNRKSSAKYYYDHIAIGDIDQDGKNDIVASKANYSETVVYKNTGNFNFIKKQTLSSHSVSYTNGIHIADLNQDDYPELVLVKDKKKLVVFENRQGGFKQDNNYNLDAKASGITSADLNQDGNKDILVPFARGTRLNNKSSLAIFSNQGNLNFSKKKRHKIYSGVTDISKGDFNNDSIIDLLLVARNVRKDSSKGFALYIGDTKSNARYSNTITTFPYTKKFFSPIENQSIQTSSYEKVATGDINNDGLDDVVYLDRQGRTLEVFHNSGGGQLKLQETININKNKNSHKIPIEVTIDDLNQDGLEDLIILSKDEISPTWGFPQDKNSNPTNKGAKSYINVVLNQDSGNFADPISYDFTGSPAGTSEGSITTGDLNGDGASDVVVEFRSRLIFFKNNGQGKLTKTKHMNDLYHYSKLKLTDFNQDGKLDILTTGVSKDDFTDNDMKMIVLENQGNFIFDFSQLTSIAPGEGINEIYSVDLDQDRYKEVAIITDKTRLVVYDNERGKLKEERSYNFDFDPSAITGADLNQDGKKDLVVTFSNFIDYEKQPYAVLLFNQESLNNLKFRKEKKYYDYPTSKDIDNGDLNHDSTLDLITASNSSSIHITPSSSSPNQSEQKLDPVGFKVQVAEYNDNTKKTKFFRDGWVNMFEMKKVKDGYSIEFDRRKQVSYNPNLGGFYATFQVQPNKLVQFQGYKTLNNAKDYVNDYERNAYPRSPYRVFAGKDDKLCQIEKDDPEKIKITYNGREYCTNRKTVYINQNDNNKNNEANLSHISKNNLKQDPNVAKINFENYDSYSDKLATKYKTSHGVEFSNPHGVIKNKHFPRSHYTEIASGEYAISTSEESGVNGRTKNALIMSFRGPINKVGFHLGGPGGSGNGSQANITLIDKKGKKIGTTYERNIYKDITSFVGIKSSKKFKKIKIQSDYAWNKVRLDDLYVPKIEQKPNKEAIDMDMKIIDQSGNVVVDQDKTYKSSGGFNGNMPQPVQLNKNLGQLKLVVDTNDLKKDIKVMHRSSKLDYDFSHAFAYRKTEMIDTITIDSYRGIKFNYNSTTNFNPGDYVYYIANVSDKDDIGGIPNMPKEIDNFGVMAVRITSSTVDNKNNTAPCPLEPGPYSYQETNSVWQITESCTKRLIPSMRKFNTYYDSASSIKSTSKETLSSITNSIIGQVPYGPRYNPKGGGLVTTPHSNKVYLIIQDKKYWINNMEVFTALNYKLNWVKVISKDLLKKYKYQGPLKNKTHHPEGSLITYTNSNKVYKIEKNSAGNWVKRHITNERVFRCLGYSFNRVITIRPDMKQNGYQDYKTGSPISNCNN